MTQKAPINRIYRAWHLKGGGGVYLPLPALFWINKTILLVTTEICGNRAFSPYKYVRPVVAFGPSRLRDEPLMLFDN